jgi:ABC-type multidrug transport system fused ATPase/permease subunit
MLEAAFELFVPLVIANIIDIGIADADMNYVIRMGLMLLTLAVIGLVCSITAQYFSAKAATGFATKLRHALFSHIEGLSFAELDTIGTDTLITRMTSDVNQVQNGVNLTLRLFLRSPFIVFGAMIMAFRIDVKAALVFVVTIPLLSIVVFGIMIVTIPLYRNVQAGLDKVLSTTRENLMGVRVIRAFNKEEDERKTFYERTEELNAAQKFVGKISGLTNPVTFVIVNAATIVLIWTGAIRVDGGILTQGMVVALVNYMSQILVELIKLANLIVSITKAIACANRLSKVFEMQPSVKNPENPVKEAQAAPYCVEFDDVSFAYERSAEAALSDLTFQVKQGETVGIIGGTGSGKSTLVNLIPRYYDVTAGKILVDGVDVRAYDRAVIRDKVGMVMQKAVLFQGTIRENLCWGRKDATDEELWEALTKAQAADFVREKEGGLDYVIEQGGKNLSGGQRQRMTIARALVKKPEILILDDSASALDYATDAALRMAIRSMSREMTVFIVSQRAASIMHADRIIVLDDGHVAGMGTHEDLLKNCDVYAEIYHSQFKEA